MIIARKLNIKKNNFDKFSNQTPVWFLFGELFLEEEINFLKSKIKAPSKKPSALGSLKFKTINFIKLEAELKELKSIDALLLKPEVAIISLPSTVPNTPIEPNKKDLILLGILLGLSVGIIFSFINNAFASRKEQKDSSAHS